MDTCPSAKLIGMIAETDIFKAFLEVLGAREPGIRLTVSVTKTPGQIAKIAQAIFAAGGDIISLGTFLGESTETGEITIKVDGLQKEALVALVKPFVEKVLDVREKVIV